MLTNLKISTIQRRKIAAVSAVLGMIIGIGITAAVGAGVYFAFQEQADIFSTSSSIEVKNMSVVRTGDTLKITANVKNVGSTSISNMWINSISAGDSFKVSYDSCAATGDPHSGCLKTEFGSASVYSDIDSFGDEPKDAVNSGASSNKLEDTTFNNTLSQLAFDKNTGSESLQGGSTQSIQIVITSKNGTRLIGSSTPTQHICSAASGDWDGAVNTCENVGQISKAVQIAERITLQLGYKSGTDEFLSDSYNTRVKPG